jgi:hypothetical protein
MLFWFLIISKDYALPISIDMPIGKMGFLGYGYDGFSDFD